MSNKPKPLFYREANIFEADSRSVMTRGVTGHEAEPMVRVRWRGKGRYMDQSGVVHNHGDVFLMPEVIARRDPELEILWN